MLQWSQSVLHLQPQFIAMIQSDPNCKNLYSNNVLKLNSQRKLEKYNTPG